MAADTVTIAQFVLAHGITMTSEWADRNPNMQDSENMDHWKVVLRMGRRRLTTYFSQGYGHNGKEPNVRDVLDCLASDSASIENCRGFEDWASDLGYDADSRKAEKTYRATEHASKRLRKFLGDDIYHQLLWNVDRG